MFPGLKKLWVALGLAIIALVGLLLLEARQSRQIVTKTVTAPLLALNGTALSITPEDYVLGNPGAPLTVVGYFDVSDAHSRQLYRAIAIVVRREPRAVRLVYKSMAGAAIFSAADRTQARAALYCAGKQKKFFEFADAVTAGRNLWRPAGLIQIVKAIGLDQNRWQQCLASPATAAELETDAAAAQSVTGGAVPVIFINNKRANLPSDVDIGQMLSSFATP